MLLFRQRGKGTIRPVNDTEGKGKAPIKCSIGFISVHYNLYDMLENYF